MSEFQILIHNVRQNRFRQVDTNKAYLWMVNAYTNPRKSWSKVFQVARNYGTWTSKVHGDERLVVRYNHDSSIRTPLLKFDEQKAEELTDKHQSDAPKKTTTERA